MASVFDEARAYEQQSTPPTPAVNPHPEGSELWSWYNDQLASKGAPQVASTGVFKDAPPAGFTPPAPEPKPEYRGAILPLTRDSTGNVSFTPMTAGPIGSMVEAAQLPGRVKSGEIKVDPSNPSFMGSVLNMAGTFGGVNPMVRSGESAVPGAAMYHKYNPKNYAAAATPPGPELVERGGAQHAAFRELPIDYNPQHMPVLAQQMEQALINHGVFPEDAKGLYKTINRLRTSSMPDPTDPTSVHQGQHHQQVLQHQREPQRRG